VEQQHLHAIVTHASFHRLMSSPLVSPSKPCKKWPRRDLIRLWPWLLAFEVVLLCLFRRVHSIHTSFSFLELGTVVWMIFFILRRTWGHHRAHIAATLLSAAPLLASLGVLPWSQRMGSYALLIFGTVLLYLFRHRFLTL
jgi:hypothetical protein